MAVSGTGGSPPPGGGAGTSASSGSVAGAASREPPLLILRALGLGDLLTAVPALRALQAAFPGRRRLLATPPQLAALAALIGPDPARRPAPRERAVTAVVPLPAWVGGCLRPDPAAAGELPRGTVAVNLHGRGPFSHRLLLATAPTRLIAFAHPAVEQSADGPAWEIGREEHERERWCRMLSAHGIAADPGALDLPAPLQLVPATVRDATVIHPGAASAARRWPAERWAEVARAERRAGRPVLISGSPAERPLAERVADAAGLPRDAVLAGRTRDLTQLAALVAGAGRLLCGDTGVAHLATAFGTPSVVLFGPVSPRVWGPPPERARHQVLWAGEPGDPHADEPARGLLAIEPRAVLEGIERLERATAARASAPL